MLQAFLKRVEGRKAEIGVVGLGYVGLPLALEFIKGGFKVTGLDIDAEKVKMLLSSKSYINHIKAASLKSANATGRLSATTDFSRARSCDAIIICVPDRKSTR